MSGPDPASDKKLNPFGLTQNYVKRQNSLLSKNKKRIFSAKGNKQDITLSQNSKKK